MTDTEVSWTRFCDLLRVFAAMKLSQATGRVVDKLLGRRTFPEKEQITRMRTALGTIVTLLDASHPACRVALDALDRDELTYRKDR